ncbi:uncharacterized protein LOC133531717 [Cydia pomonella]|uniref:uncharacterized protein LOC133531717 n=1 Tax=Cydia pomonella TaxID=82600 RepID=UPI002ADDF913|nr:uncharacterized protein LOC133531717 [Cydia pomonella]
MSENSPFNRSGLTRRSPPSTPTPQPGPPGPAPANMQQEEEPPKVFPTSDIQTWLKKIELNLQDVCATSAEGKLNSDQKIRINNLCRTVTHYASQMAVEYQALKQHAIQAYQSRQAHQEKIVSGSVSFADALKKNGSRYVQPSNISSVAIYPVDKLKSSEETKSLVQKIIRPDEMKLHVRGLRKIRNGGVVISTDSREDVIKLKQSAQLTTSGLTVDEPQKRKPRIVVIGVPTDMQEPEVLKCIYQQNLADKLQDWSLEKFMASIKLSHKSGKKGAETCNYIIEVSGVIRKALITNDRVFVNWSSCPVRDFTLVTRCFKCQFYGHAAKTCKMESNVCGHCGEAGHSFKECTKKDKAPKCATCFHYKKPCDHETGDAECPARQLAEKRYINSIDYEGA